MKNSVAAAFRKIANKYGSRHKKAYAKGVKAKKLSRIGKLSRGRSK